MLSHDNDYDIHIAPHPTPPVPPAPKEEDIRLAMSTKIWRYATGMLALCIPLMAVSDHAPTGGEAIILPLAVIGGATASTIAVWVFGSRASTTHSLPSPNEQQQLNHIKQLEERLSNVETISRYERLVHEAQINRQGMMPPSPEVQSFASTPLGSGRK